MKNALYRLVVLIVFAAGAGVVFFYFQQYLGEIKQIPTQYNTINNLISALPQIENLEAKPQGSIHLPQPLKYESGQISSTLSTNGVVLWTNQKRRLEGQGSLAVNQQLNQAAGAKLKDMFEKQYFAHNSPDGLTPSDFIENANYEYIKTGENLALGNFADDAELVQAWMDSPGHRENILTSDFTEIGVAVGQGEYEGKTTWMAVQVFGRPISSCPNVDQGLKTAIDANQAKLNSLQAEIDGLKTRLESEKPRGQFSQEKADEYNALVAQYNELANQYNALVQQTQGLINNYNAQIKNFNECANAV